MSQDIRSRKTKRNILVVNDDGIRSEGIRRLAEAAVRFGRVWVVAPERQCSGMSQKISIFDPIPVTPYAFPAPVEGAWSIGGTPADCVKAAVNFLLDEKPDVVFSGINNGFNTGFDTAYSGTVGAAMEALMKGIPAIAFSRPYEAVETDFETVDAYLLPLMEELLASPLPPNEMWNVNFPGVPLNECRGVLYDRSVAPLQLYRDHYRRTEAGDGAFTLQNISTPAAASDAPEGSDVHAVLSGFVSVGRLRCPVL